MRWQSGTLTVAFLVLIIAGGWAMTLRERPASVPSTAGLPSIDNPVEQPQPAPAAPQVPPADGIAGYGATVSAWNALHAGNDRYQLGTPQNGRVVRYSLQLPPHTGIDAARRAAMAEFPPDARTVWFAAKNSCAQLEVESPMLARVLGAARPGQAPGRVLAEFDSVLANGQSVYDPSSVGEVFFIQGDPGPSYGC